MEAILDFSKPFNPALLDEIISVFYSPHHPEQGKAGQVLYDLKESDRAWSIADSIIEQCKDSRSIFFGLILLEEMVKNRWAIVPLEQRESIKNYSLAKVMSYSETMESIQQNEEILHKWDIILVEIFKKEWPNSWTSFVKDLVAAAVESESRCRNSMFILKIVVEDVFQFSETTLTSKFSQQIQQALQSDMIDVFNLCSQVIVNTEVVPLLLDTIDTIRLILKYLPDDCVFNYQLADVLLKFITIDQFRTSAMMCLQEILCHPNSYKYPSLISQSIRRFLEYLQTYVDVTVDLSTSYTSLSSDLTDFVHELSVFLTSISLRHKSMLESQYQDVYLQICTFVLFLSRCPDREVLKVCMKFWKEWCHSIYQAYSTNSNSATSSKQPEGPYTNLTQQLIQLIVERMSRPEEVMMMENEDGEVVRVETKDTDGIALYKIMKECLVLLASVDYEITEAILMNALDIQLKPTDPFRSTLQPLIWSIGSLNGVLTEADERRLLMATIMDILRLVASKVTKDDKAVVAGCLMYVIQQFPRFLKHHFKFLRTVINKNFEFMHETHPGVQDMSCDTFEKIAKQCGYQLVIPQQVDGQEWAPYINEIIAKLEVFVELLNQQQREVVYRGVASACRCERNPERRLVLIDSLLYRVNERIVEVIKKGCVDEREFHSLANIQLLRNSLRFHRVVFQKFRFMTQYQDFADLFSFYSRATIQSVKENGELVAGYSQTRQERLLLRDIIRLFQCFIERVKGREVNDSNQIDLNSVCQQTLSLILKDYEDAPECLKEPCCLQFSAVVLEKLKSQNSTLTASILSSVFLSTLHLITSNRLKYPELTLTFFTLLSAVARYSFLSLFSFNMTELKLIVDSIIWGYLDSERRIYENSLETMLVVMESVRACEGELRQGFYQQFWVYIVEHTL
ncbi:exportin-1 [Blastocystis sp. subtype 4]|uniref:exportin-1 n=1 Tax=Blastocystis sp. subtype 4 TaxID=944170 RepID=UPI00071188D2|nr:exportin-1 [Blastocystis sp. subtype 4]KNB42717.1 exportin-1 [Blastocystis sp. subtype 4]|eukprot:XP_014526160.1 exportin-1 [Blastocystis sp. subtype 4]